MIRIKEESRKDKKEDVPVGPPGRPALSFCAPSVVLLVGKGIIGKEEE